MRCYLHGDIKKKNLNFVMSEVIVGEFTNKTHKTHYFISLTTLLTNYNSYFSLSTP